MRKFALRTILSKLFLACAGLFAGFLFVELALAIFSPQPDFYFFKYANGGYIFNKPNFANYVASVPFKKATTALVGSSQKMIRQYKMFFRANNAGFRNDKPSTYEKTAGIYRIMNLGDSLGLGFPLPREESYAGLIENNISDTEVFNSSVIFTHTARLLQYYQREGYKYEPDMVIVQLTRSHLMGDYLNLDSFGKSAFELSLLRASGKYESIKHFTVKDEAGIEELVLPYLEDTKPLFAFFNEKLDRSGFLYHYLHTARLIYNNGILMLPTSKIFLSYTRRNGPITEGYKRTFSGYGQNYSDIFPPSPFVAGTNNNIQNTDYKFTLAYLEAFHNLLAEKNKKLMVIILPNYAGCEGATYAMWQELSKELNDKKYNVIDFYDDFCDYTARKAKEEFYLPQEIHLGAAGHKLIAERLISEIDKIKNAR